MPDYKKAWEDSVKYAHKLELELEKTKAYFAAELSAAKNDYGRYKQLESINTDLLDALDLLVGEDGDLFSDEAHSKARELIRKHKGEDDISDLIAGLERAADLFDDIQDRKGE